MKPWRRMTLYLVLNVLVSALTTLAVLVAWDRLRGPMPTHIIPSFSWNWFSRPEPTPITPEPTPMPQATPTPTFVVYQVQSGDTFESIAEQYGVPVDVLMAENGFSAGTILGVGEVLRIPVLSSGPEPGSVIVDRVVGAGDLSTERVVILYTGSEEFSLSGWVLEAPAGQEYPFPQLTLFKDVTVSVFTQAGSDTASELYWGLETPLWASGDEAILRDPSGEVFASYTVP